MTKPNAIIGREEEMRLLRRAYESHESEFVAIYGRRRVGKTFLVRKYFNNNFTFQYTGIYNIPNKKQLEEFHRSLKSQGLVNNTEVPKSWFEAFHMLECLISDSSAKRKVIFIDELPWMDTRNSRFVQALENFWNGWVSTRTDVLLVICGSATSWIINKIFRNKGGLYNRVSYKIPLTQFSLYECELLVKDLNLPFNRNMIMEGYMVMGGIPYYWTKLDPEKSMGKNINDLFLIDKGLLHNEFSYLYASMFNKPEKYMKVVEVLTDKKAGLTREEIINKGKIDSSGQLTDILDDLIQCGLIRKYCHLDKKLKDAFYQLIDCYTLFYFRIVKNSHGIDEDYWVKTMGTPEYNTWCGLSFERLCLLHSRQIKAALGISGIRANLFSWHIKKTDDHPGVQIDLLIDRSDGIFNICEMKYAPGGYRLTSAELNKIRNRISVFNMYMPANKASQPVLITSNGVIRNSWSDEIPLKVSGDQLFLP